MLKEDIKYQDVTDRFEKDRGYEEFIEAFNNHLAIFEEDQYRDLPETLPSVHVIGVPRSGTTLLTQLINSHLDVGYINNLIGRFWKAPVSAIRISRKLLGNSYSSTLTSDYGKTDKIYEPNEFNYLWYDLLEYESHHQKTDSEAQKNIDWQRVARVMKNMLWAYEKSIVFKSFMLGWHAHHMHRVLNKTCFIWIKRNPIDTALSLLGLRRDLFGTIERWASFKPSNYKQLLDKNPVQQVAGQVYYFEQSYQKEIDQLPESNYVILNYEEVCRSPLDALTKIKSLINSNGGQVNLVGNEVLPQEPSTKRAEDYEEYETMRKALESFYSQ